MDTYVPFWRENKEHIVHEFIWAIIRSARISLFYMMKKLNHYTELLFYII